MDSVEAQQLHREEEELEEDADASGEEEGVEEEAEAGLADADADADAEGEDDEEDEEDDSDVDQVVNNGHKHSNGAVGGGGMVEEDEDPEKSSAVPPPSPSSSSLAFPVSRVRRVIKKNDIAAVGMEAIFVIAKAAELFLEQFVEESYDNMCEDNRSSLAYKDLSSTVVSAERLEFLADFVPEKVPASRALAEAPFQIS